jgi:predicted aminopeptidase
MLTSFRALPRILAVLALLLALSGCYLMQAASGQMAIVSKRQPIAQVVANSSTPQTLRARLEYVRAARDFASRELGLPDNESYRSYADVGRPYVIWNVFATDEFSVEPRRWCFPIAGCVVYRGYFSEDAAQSYARRLRLRGDDTAVGGVAAYSTLGHFKDPVLNTMMAWSDAQLAATLFHELAHQVAYVPGDSEFNEAFATVVEEEGLERWLASRDRATELQAWRTQRQRGSQFIALLLRTRDRLKELYASGLPPAQMRERKQYAFGELKLEYAQLRHKWGGYGGYDHFFDRTLNNAHLVSAATYYGCVPGLQRLLRESGGDLPLFYERVRELTRLDAQARASAVCSDAPPATLPVTRSGTPASSSRAGS